MKNQSSGNYFPAISGLRAISVIAVILYHINPRLLPAGFVGVDFFFVISGYVVTHSMRNYAHEGQLRFLVGFYRRRIARLMPALLFFLFIGIALSSFIIPKSFLLTSSNKTALLAFFGFSNIYLWRVEGGYFSPTSDYNFFVHTWSLAIEEQFYLICSFLTFFIVARSVTAERKRVALVIYGLLAFCSLLACAYFTNSDRNLAFYLIFTRFWELAAGALLCLLTPSALRYANGTIWNLFLFGLLVASFTVPALLPFPFPGALLPVIAALVCIHLVVNGSNGAVTSVLSHPILVYIGNISYSLYLWHWLFVVLARWTVGLESPVIMGAIFVVSIMAGAFSYHFVENPSRNSAWARSFTPTRFYVSFICLFFLVSSVSMFAIRYSSLINISVTNEQSVWYPYVTEKAGRPKGSCKVNVEEHAASFGKRLDLLPVDCQIEKLPKMVVIGDSHAGAYSRMLYQLSARDNRQVEIYELSGCAPFRLTLYGEIPSAECLTYINNVLEKKISSMVEGDVLFFPALRMRRYRDIGGGDVLETNNVVSTPSGYKNDQANLDLMAEKLLPFSKNGINIIFETPKPLFRSAPLLCADWYTSQKSYCNQIFDIPKDEFYSRGRDGFELTSSIVAKLPGAKLWNSFDVLCPGSKCSAFSSGKPLYFDGDHLSGYANDLLLPSFKSLLTNASFVGRKN